MKCYLEHPFGGQVIEFLVFMQEFKHVSHTDIAVLDSHNVMLLLVFTIHFPHTYHARNISVASSFSPQSLLFIQRTNDDSCLCCGRQSRSPVERRFSKPAFSI